MKLYNSFDMYSHMDVQLRKRRKAMIHVRPTHDSSRKDNRLQIRVDEESYHVLEKAAQYKNGSLSRFVREVSLREAQKVIREHENMALSDRDWALLMEALSHPVKPNAALKKAYVNYKKTFQK